MLPACRPAHVCRIVVCWFAWLLRIRLLACATAGLLHTRCRYAYLYHQKDMLEDHKRTGSYYNACMQNRAQFAGKVVLDVGTGSGILAIFAAKAGGQQSGAVLRAVLVGGR